MNLMKTAHGELITMLIGKLAETYGEHLEAIYRKHEAYLKFGDEKERLIVSVLYCQGLYECGLSRSRTVEKSGYWHNWESLLIQVSPEELEAAIDQLIAERKTA
ncbi:hypothetical protein [Cardiobacterium hominis]|jgi:hypothetical protein|uniref:hypothetical protein n=1 Tax=Cardiobacterium hominis TaxID=2718 RepID=UPI002064ECE4|nr:hypothetical protein [Cardiobacterium hominis]DAK29130.1 MAG TPA: hypothetical protein [Caudoviricetes sp.]